ncbi:MAG: GDSL-type esterase/lipase family protein [Sphingomonas bacterium]|nr:GDSL-type esterase/lipase family protein [Sphingomonas bacterium]
MIGLAIALAAAAMPTDTDPAAYQSSPPRRTITETRHWGPWAGPFRDTLVPVLMRDFGERYLYADANKALPPPQAGESRVVFLGDSITDRWDLARSFPGQPYVNRGIGAQVTAQMLVRFEQDVVALQPRVVVIFGGTNDVSGFLQVETPATMVANIAAMATIAEANGIRVVLATLLPVNSDRPDRSYLARERPSATLVAINTAIRTLAREHGYALADYAPALTDTRRQLKSSLTEDGLHPNARGYALMTPVAAAAIAQALAEPIR